MVTPRIRTMLRSLRISGYRSIRELELGELPPLVVFFGPNGSGKSNILRALRLACRATAWADELPLDRSTALSLKYVDANKELELRPEDFHRPGAPEIRIAFSLVMGDEALQIVRPEVGSSLLKGGDLLSIALVFQDVGGGTLRLWWEKADVGGTLTLGPSKDPVKLELRTTIAQLRGQRDAHEQQLLGTRQQAEAAGQQRSLFNSQLAQRQHAIDALETTIADLAKRLGEETLLADRIRRVFLGESVIQVSEAYRRPEGDTEALLAERFLSADQREHEAITRLGRRLTEIGLFGASTMAISLRPAVSKPFGETQVLISHPTAGELPLRNLGTGEQQLILMLADRVVTPSPISHLEEPEAHLHRTLMEPLARSLRESVLPPDSDDSKIDVDQLWIATHHHLFAISEEFYDVSLKDGETFARRKPRPLAGVHFYEPGPLWDALRNLMESGLDRSTVLFVKPDGTCVTVADIEASERGDRTLFVEWVDFVTSQLVLSMKTSAAAKA